MNLDLPGLAKRLARLHQQLEISKDRGNDWILARVLEDRIGAGMPVTGDVEKAKALLDRHNV